jgi:hypothetical protein
MMTLPLVPSTSISSPSPIATVPTPTAVTVGTPYSRPTMAAWLSIPPPSHTAAAIRPNAGVQFGDVDSQTRISPGASRCSSSELCSTRAMPVAWPRAAGTPFSVVSLAASGFCTARNEPGLMPKISISTGSSTDSGMDPNTLGISPRRTCQWSKYCRRAATRLRSSPEYVPPPATSVSSGQNR